MHSVSSTYQQIVASDDHWFDTRVTIAGTEYYGSSIISVATRAHTFGTNTIELGHADSREIELSLFGTSAYIPRNAQIVVWVRAMSADGSRSSEWIQKGVFYIDTRSKDSQTINGQEVIEIVGFDAMMKGEMVFQTFPSGWMEAGKTTAYDLVQYSAQLIGVNIDQRTYDVMSTNFDVLLPTQFSVREALKNVSALYGGSFIINDYGQLQLIAPWRSTGSYDLGQNAQELTVIPPHAACSGVRMIVKDEGYRRSGEEDSAEYYFSGSESGYVFEIGSPWGTQNQTDWLYGMLSGYVYNPYQVTSGELDPKVEIGDTITVGTVTSGLYSQEITFGPYFTSDFGAPGEEEIDHEYAYETSTDRKYSRRLYNAEALLSVHSDEIMARVTKESPEGQSDFWWQLLDYKFEVGTGSKTIFRVDENGGYFDGDGTFTGSLESGEIYIPSREDYNFKVDRSGNMEARSADVTGTIRASSFQTSDGQSLATLDQLQAIANSQHGGFGGGLSGLSAAALKFGNASKESSSDYPEYFTAGTFIANAGIISRGNVQATGSVSAQHFYINGTQQHGDDPIDLATHSHSISFSEDGDKIQLKITGPSGINPQTASFSIAATQTYQDMVAALTISSYYSRVGISQTSDGTAYDIEVRIRNDSGDLLYEQTETTSDAVYWNGYYKGQDEAPYDWDAYWDGHDQGLIDAEVNISQCYYDSYNHEYYRFVGEDKLTSSSYIYVE